MAHELVNYYTILYYTILYYVTSLYYTMFRQITVDFIYKTVVTIDYTFWDMP